MSDNDLNRLFNIPKITVTIGGLLFLVSVGLIYVYDRYPNSRKTLEFAVLTCTASTGITSVFYFGRNSRLEQENKAKERCLEQENNKINRSLELNSQWNSLVPLYLKGETLKLLKDLEQKTPADQINKINETFDNDNDVKQSIISILNFLEKLAVAVEEKDVNEDRVFNYYRNIVIRYYSLFSPWISQLRQERTQNGEVGDRYYKSFEALCNLWKNKQ